MDAPARFRIQLHDTQAESRIYSLNIVRSEAA